MLYWIMGGIIIVALLWMLGIEIVRIYDAFEKYEKMENKDDEEDI